MRSPARPTRFASGHALPLGAPPTPWHARSCVSAFPLGLRSAGKAQASRSACLARRGRPLIRPGTHFFPGLTYSVVCSCRKLKTY